MFESFHTVTSIKTFLVLLWISKTVWFSNAIAGTFNGSIDMAVNW